VLALENLPDTTAREAARGLVRAVLDLHAIGFRRVLELAETDTTNRLADDALVGSLLLLHDVHPYSAETRVNRALEQMRERFVALGGDVQLIDATDDVVQFRLRGDPDSGPALRSACQNLVIDAVPDVTKVEFEEAWDGPAFGRVALPLLPGVSRGTV
jgi:hypothetical protein